jgi:hypothetical protein
LALVITREESPARSWRAHQEFGHEHLLDSQRRLKSLVVISKGQFVPSAHMRLSAGQCQIYGWPIVFLALRQRASLAAYQFVGQGR